MAILMPEGKQSFTNDAGVPLAGGRLYTYAAGTTTPKTTWADSAQTAPNTNPIILDARGEATVFWNGSYKVVLKTAADVTVWSVDGVAAVTDPVSTANLATSSGSSLVGFIQAGTGAIARTLQSKDRDLYSAKDFGATGDGSTNDTAAIQAALTAVGALTTGGEVWLPSGTYACASTLTIPAKVTLRMSGARIVSSATTAIQITLGAASASGRIIGAGQSSIIQHTGTGYAIRMNGTGESSANPMLANIQIIGSSSGLGGIYATKFNAMFTENVKVNGYTNGVAMLHYGVNAVTHMGPILEACANGIINTAIMSGGTAYSANAIRVFGGSIVGMTAWGWVENQEAGANPNLANLAEAVVFENNGVNGSGTSGHIFVQQSVAFTANACYFEDYTGAVPVNAIIIGDGTYAPQGVIITDSMFGTTGTNVISNVNGQTVNINGNVCVGVVTNFYNQGASARGAVVRANRALAAASVVAGTDGGIDTITDSGTFANAYGATIRGVGFNRISGLTQDLRIQTRSGGARAVQFEAIDGTLIGYMSNSGALGCFAVEIGGNQVVGARNTGWTAMTGTASKGGFATGSVTTAQLAQVVKALTDALITSGAIGA